MSMLTICWQSLAVRIARVARRVQRTPGTAEPRRREAVVARESGKSDGGKDLWNLVAGSGVTENGRTRAACGPTRS